LQTIALIAGEGAMPRLILEETQKLHIPVFLLAIKGMAHPDLQSLAAETQWLHFTQLGASIKACLKRGIREVSLAGRVQHNKLFSFSLLKTDWTTFKTLKNLPDWRTDTILKAVVNAYETQGILMASSVKYLKSFLAKLGFITNIGPSEDDTQSIQLALNVAKKLTALDIGQTVVVKNKSIVAVEAMEGTDRCLERAGELAGKGCIMVKLAKPHQDMRFDVPVIGKNTIEKLIKIKAKGLVVESDKTLLLDKNLIQLAERHNIFIQGVQPREI
jgi:DUF1009 family protein